MGLDITVTYAVNIKAFYSKLNAHMSHGLPISAMATVMRPLHSSQLAATGRWRDSARLGHETGCHRTVSSARVCASAQKRKRRAARPRTRSNVEQGPARQVIQAPGLGEFLGPEAVSGQPQSRISFRSVFDLAVKIGCAGRTGPTLLLERPWL